MTPTLEEKAQAASDRFDKTFVSSPPTKFYLGFVAGYRLKELEDSSCLKAIERIKAVIEELENDKT